MFTGSEIHRNVLPVVACLLFVASSTLVVVLVVPDVVGRLWQQQGEEHLVLFLVEVKFSTFDHVRFFVRGRAMCLVLVPSLELVYSRLV